MSPLIIYLVIGNCPWWQTGPLEIYGFIIKFICNFLAPSNTRALGSLSLGLDSGCKLPKKFLCVSHLE